MKFNNGKSMKYLRIFFTSIISFLFFISCSDIREDIPISAPKITLHKDGIKNPASPNFHGKLVSNANWDMKQCQQCHAANYNGGTAESSCYNCHKTPGGPEACNTCHGDFANTLRIAPPRALNGNILSSDRGVGAHTKHLYDNKLGKIVSCNQCHIEPASGFSDPSHIDNTPGAEIVFGSLSKLQTNVSGGFNYQSSLGNFVPNPGFDVSDGSCSNNYCHGYFKNGNLDNIVLFTAQSQGAACGTCHGNAATGNPLPKTPSQGGSHPPSLNCQQCHGDVVENNNGNYTIVNKEKHINGKLNVFDNEFEF
ncbi:MAG: hypothetical protein WA440_05810 [Ignavibacteriaceae bacterium]